ncbi:protein jagunal homolog 1-like [Asterias rubens]|uniref:protein jagunal homolog 1-like n=1 Tax=Asterias rubens TaxID=7604 RepID=UPI0014553529|nr:protein jagunal homolog 1-like [Asterias rubens]
MASRGGPRAVGSDGSDFTHREQVAVRYQTSTLLKSKVRVCAYVNLLVSLPQAAYIANAHLNYILLPPVIQPGFYHYMILLSSIFSLLYIMALPRNKKLFIQLGNLGTLLIGLGGVMVGLLVQFPSIKQFLVAGDFKKILQPDIFLAVTWYIVLKIKIILFIQTIYYARKLQATWDAKKTK